MPRARLRCEVIEALAPYKHNAKLMQRLETALTERGDPRCSNDLDALAR